MREVIGDDERFLLATAERNLGFYANFERALAMTPSSAPFVALCDQDDEWHADKLEALIAGLEPGAALVYSDMRIVDRSGGVISGTYWAFRRNNHTDFASLVLANTVTGAASLFRRELLADVLPFPPRHGNAFHDHWIAQVAMALGPISYVDRPLYDYVQHDEAAIGYLSANGGGRFGGSPLRRARISAQRLRRRRWHLGWRVPYFKVYCRIVVAATALELRCGDRMDPGKAEVLATLRDPQRAARWLAGRVARERLATTETLGRERVMLAGLAWHAFERGRRRLPEAVRPRRRGA
jgi:glycosyltransferase involved in cell wall biosynthesis